MALTREDQKALFTIGKGITGFVGKESTSLFENSGWKRNVKGSLFTRQRCKGCPLKTLCIGKSYEKKISITAYREEYERAIARLKSHEGRYHKGKRMSTVEPVFFTAVF
ncbi:MAG: transposase [Chitinophagales bacterium]